ncbi:MAG: SUMF1/EgtB/PvdO family nonheme iron enzyme, partial [Opitutae bacterium]|nr:SUMF1/EgtB/PvdO family nonheme iron enzyme [Opitutae bacterium]
FDATQPFGGGKSGLSLGETKDVGSYFANPWGFYDMHGNVVEKVYDWKGKYPERKAVDSMGPAKGSAKLSRGGSYMQSADQIRSARRGNGGTLRYKGKHAGFRLCLKQVKEEGTQEVIPLKSLPKEARSEQKDDKSFSADLLAAVKNWKVIPKSVFPLSNVTIQKAVEVTILSPTSGQLIGNLNLPAGREVVVLEHKEGILTISPTRTSLSRGSIKMEDTDFKDGVAYLFELRKMQRELALREKKPNYIVKSALNMELIWCKPGNFVMGDGSKVEGPKDPRSGKHGPPHQVFLSKGFYLGKYEVTQEEFEKIMGKNPSNFKGKKLPVERVTWSDAVAFCEALTKNEKMNGWMFSLPTEAQWEYACRAGTNTKYSWGDNINPKMANYKDSGLNKTVLVGSYQSNPWGLFDMHGNVFEWCADWYGSYRTGSLTDPKGPVSPVHFSQLGSLRVIRGGAWFRVGNSALSAHREYRNPEKYKYYDLGFRVCLQARKDG